MAFAVAAADELHIVDLAVLQVEEDGPGVEYTLTETGYSLKPILDSMWAWGADYKAKNG